MASGTKFVRGGLSLSLVLAVAPVVGEFFVKLAEEQGAYQRPTERLGAAVNWLSGLAGDHNYQLALAALAGLVAGVWIDWLLRRGESILAHEVRRRRQVCQTPAALASTSESPTLVARRSLLHARIGDALADLGAWTKQYISRDGDNAGAILYEKVDKISALTEQIAHEGELASECRYYTKLCMLLHSKKEQKASTAAIELQLNEAGHVLFGKLH